VRAVEGYRSACSSLGVRPLETACDITTDSTVECVEELLRERPAVTAVVTTNDEAVAGLMTALHAAGRRVPTDISVLGVIGPTRARQLTRPPLTVVELPTAEMAAVATRQLIIGLDEPDGRQTTGTLFDPPVTERGSCAPPPP
jgi:DNA-binding LacI/PurR family transcriptional regulator